MRGSSELAQNLNDPATAFHGLRITACEVSRDPEARNTAKGASAESARAPAADDQRELKRHLVGPVASGAGRRRARVPDPREPQAPSLSQRGRCDSHPPRDRATESDESRQRSRKGDHLGVRRRLRHTDMPRRCSPPAMVPVARVRRRAHCRPFGRRSADPPRSASRALGTVRQVVAEVSVHEPAREQSCRERRRRRPRLCAPPAAPRRSGIPGS